MSQLLGSSDISASIGICVLRAIIDLSFDLPDPDDTEKAENVFESRGVSLSLLRCLYAASTQWQQTTRVLLSSGESGIVLVNSRGDEPLSAQCWLQIRCFSDKESWNLYRRYVSDFQSSIKFENLVATIGERVKYFKNSSNKDTMDPTDNAEYGTVVDVVVNDGDDVQYIICLSSSEDDKVNCNYCLNSGVGEMLSVGGDCIVRDDVFTTKDMCEEIIKPLTRRSKQSLVCCLARLHCNRLIAPSINGSETDGAISPSSLTDEGPRDLSISPLSTCLKLGKADAFVSHAWKYNFKDVVDSLELWFNANHKTPALDDADLTQAMNEYYLWFDICTIPQHPDKQMVFPPDYFFNEFREGIKAISNTVLVMIPMLQPLPLSRAWCVWEIYCSLACRANFSTAITSQDQHYRDTHSMRLRINPNVKAATSWNLRDAERIIAACETVEGGCKTIDNTVAEAFALDQVQHVIYTHRYGFSQHLRDLNRGVIVNADTHGKYNYFNFLNLSSLHLGNAACVELASYFKELNELYHKFCQEQEASGQELEPFDSRLGEYGYPTLDAFALLGIDISSEQLSFLLSELQHLPGLCSFAFNDFQTTTNTQKCQGRFDSDCLRSLTHSLASPRIKHSLRQLQLLRIDIDVLAFRDLMLWLSDSNVMSLSVQLLNSVDIWSTQDEKNKGEVGCGTLGFAQALQTCGRLVSMSLKNCCGSDIAPHEQLQCLIEAIEANTSCLLMKFDIDSITDESVNDLSGLPSHLLARLYSALLVSARRYMNMKRELLEQGKPIHHLQVHTGEYDEYRMEECEKRIKFLEERLACL